MLNKTMIYFKTTLDLGNVGDKVRTTSSQRIPWCKKQKCENKAH